MAKVKSILSEIQNLSLYEQELILSQLEAYLVLGSQVGEVTKDVKEFRFAKGKV